MPIKSKVQFRYLRAFQPKIFERFQKESPVNYRDLPERLGGQVDGPNPLRDWEDISLSENDLRRLNPGIKIISYPELRDYNSIEELLGRDGAVIILYLKKLKDGYDDSYGHWVALIKNGDNNIEFFDSYGGKPDDYKQIEPYLSELLLDYTERTGKPIEWNDYQFQEWEPDIATCGRHASMRVAFKDLRLKDYVNLFKRSNKFTSDDIVTALTIRDNEGYNGGCNCGSEETWKITS